MTETTLICIGTNNYKDRNIKKLDYCASDCFRVERTFSILNVCDSSKIIIGEKANFNYIKNEITQLRHKTKNIILYYSGHGSLIKDVTYLHLYDTNSNNITSSGLSLSWLIQTLKRQNLSTITLVLDACNIAPHYKFSKKVHVISPDKLTTFEDTKTNKSIFTDKLLADTVKKYHSIYKKNKQLQRYHRIRQNIEYNLYHKNDLLFVFGESGIGKSHFLRQMNNKEKNIFYISLPNSTNLTFEIVLNFINECMSTTSVDNKYKAIDIDPERYVRFFSQMNPHYLLLIDHIDHLNKKTLTKLTDFLLELPIQKILSSRITTKTMSKGFIYNFPKMSDEEIDEVLNVMNIMDKKIRKDCKLHSRGNYIKLLQIISEIPHHEANQNKQNLSTSSMQATMFSVAISGGFINQQLFEKTFDVKHKNVEELKQRGMIMLHEGFFYPHDSIYDSVKEQNIASFKKAACKYWKSEVEKDISNFKAVQNYILVINSFAPKFEPSENILYKNIINKLEGRQNTYFLLLIFDYLKNEPINAQLKTFLANILIDISRFQEAAIMIKTKKNNLPIEHQALLAEISWWKGQFPECIELSTQLLEKKLPHDIKINLFCWRGIGFFFLGQWEKATKDLTKVIEHAANKLSPRKAVFLAYCVLGTIQGLRGINIPDSVINFKNAVSIAKQSNKLFWLALVYGNIGEILWKAGFYKDSIKTLETATHLAYITGNDAVNLEINRNLLHAYHKFNKHEKEQIQFVKLEKIFNKEIDTYVKMQIVNTLITHYIFSNKNNYHHYLEIADKITAGNAEYQIYTKANLAIAALNQGNEHKAVKIMNQALLLCYKGENWLAIKQIMEDWDEIVAVKQLSSFATQQIFQKWHQILEKKLLPFLPHLSHLCEYLESP